MYTPIDDKTVRILGTPYDLVFIPDDSPCFEDKECDGYIDVTTKQITIAIFEPDKNSVANLDEYQKQIMRHEITHAFLYESGLWGNSNACEYWALNEEMVDWFALQHNKLHAAFEKAGAL